MADAARIVDIYKPSPWTDIFMSFSFDDQVQEMYLQETEVLKEQVLKMMNIMFKQSKIEDKITLIDTIERLGLSYHFQQQIDQQTEQIFVEFQKNIDDGIGNYDLFTTALGFRLFRQHGHNIPCSVFEKFKGKDSKFDMNLKSDINGLLSLYEATYLKFHGEDILEDAMVYTKYYLNEALLINKSDLFLQEKVKKALEQPTHWGIPRIEAFRYISIYEKEDSKIDVLIRLAKLDFNYVQNIYKKELRDFLMWWKLEVDHITKFPHVRDRMVEAYFWAIAFNFEPLQSLSRSTVFTSISAITVFNDTYDHFATFQEVRSCTENLLRWDNKEVDDELLPEYAKIICRFVFSIHDKIENEEQIKSQGKSFALPFIREAFQQLVKVYTKKVAWQLGEEVPTFADYISIAGINSTSYLLLPSSFMGIKSATKEHFEWVNSEPKIVQAISLYGRYVNDVGSYQREYKEGVLATSVDCYMKEQGVSKQEAVDKYVKLAEDCLMTVNEERVAMSKHIPSYIIERVLNYARVCYVTYGDGHDGYSNPKTTLMPCIIALFKEDPFLII